MSDVQNVDSKCWILALFIRSDGERFLLGDGNYEFLDGLQHFSANEFVNDTVEVQGNDGVLLAGQVRRAGTQAFDGYVGDASMSKSQIEEARREFFAFFQKNYYYRVVYVFPNGSAIMRQRGFIVDAPTVQEMWQIHPQYHVALNFEDVNYYVYSEDENGNENYNKQISIPVAAYTGGGEEWDENGQVWEILTEASASGSMIQITDGGYSITNLLNVYGATTQPEQPSPRAPKPVINVTGVNTVVISNGQGESMSHQLDLGSLELCKYNDNYQDYLYKADGKWYKRKEIAAVHLKDMNWVKYGLSIYFVNLDNADPYGIRLTENYTPFSTHFIPTTSTSIANRIYYTEYNAHLVVSLDADMRTEYDTVAKWQAWLNEADPVAYCPMIEPTAEEITDTALIEQLESLGAARIYPGDNLITIETQNAMPSIAIEYNTNGTAGGSVWEAGGSGGAVPVMVDSISTVYPVIVISGYTVNPRIENTTTGTSITYNGVIAAGQTLKIDMLNQTATLNGVNVVSKLTGYWLNFAPDENKIVYSPENTDAPDAKAEWAEIVG